MDIKKSLIAFSFIFVWLIGLIVFSSIANIIALHNNIYVEWDSTSILQRIVLILPVATLFLADKERFVGMIQKSSRPYVLLLSIAFGLACIVLTVIIGNLFFVNSGGEKIQMEHVLWSAFASTWGFSGALSIVYWAKRMRVLYLKET